jgi:hypothetical protein
MRNLRGVSTNKTIIYFIAMQTYKELMRKQFSDFEDSAMLPRGQTRSSPLSYHEPRVEVPAIVPANKLTCYLPCTPGEMVH